MPTGGRQLVITSLGRKLFAIKFVEADETHTNGKYMFLVNLMVLDSHRTDFHKI